MSESSTDLSQETRVERPEARDIDTLAAELYSRNGAVRQRAREALVDIGQPAVELLIEALRGPDEQVQWEAAKALGEIGDAAAAPALANLLDHGDFEVRWLAAEGLISIGREALEPLLSVLAERGDVEWIRQGAHHVLHDLAESGLQREVGSVLEALEGPDPDVEAPRAARVALYGSAGAPEEGEGV